MSEDQEGQTISPEEEYANTQLAVTQALADLLGANSNKQYNIGVYKNISSTSTIPTFSLQKSPMDTIIRSYVTQPEEVIARYQQALIDMGVKGIKANGKLNTATQSSKYINGIKNLVEAYSQQLDSIDITDPTYASKIPSLTKFIETTAFEGKAGGPSVYDTIYLTSPEDAINDFNQTSVDLLGVGADQKDAEEYAKRLKQLEEKSFQRQTTKTVGGKSVSTVIKGGVTEDEKTKLALDILGKKITVENIANVGGAIGSNIPSGRVANFYENIGT
jgi:hypothetical protein